MKNIYILALSIFTSGFAFGQAALISLDSDPATPVNGTVLNEVVDQSNYQVYMHVFNMTGGAVNWKFGRYILSQSTTISDQFCDDFVCYNCSGNPWISTTPAALTAGDSSIFKPQINLNAGETALIRYYIYDIDNADAKVDSVDINFTTPLGVEEIDISFSSYPNPASQDFFINFNGNDGVGFNLVIYNLVGEEVLKRTLNNGSNKINVERLNNGVYFYSVVTSGEIIETKKLVIRH